MEDMVGAIMGDWVVAITLITGDTAMAGGVILTGGTIPIILTTMIMVCAGVLGIEEMTLILGKGCGYPEHGFRATKNR